MTIRGIGLIAEAVQMLCFVAIAALLGAMVWGAGAQSLGWALPHLSTANPSAELHQLGSSIGANLVRRLGMAGGG